MPQDDKVGEPSGAPGNWRAADPMRLEPYFTHWMSKLTSDGLHDKSDIATVLALLHQELDDVKADYLRVHKEKCDLLFARSAERDTNEGYPGIAHDLESFRTALQQIRDEGFSGFCHDIAEAALNAAQAPAFPVKWDGKATPRTDAAIVVVETLVGDTDPDDPLRFEKWATNHVHADFARELERELNRCMIYLQAANGALARHHSPASSEQPLKAAYHEGYQDALSDLKDAAPGRPIEQQARAWVEIAKTLDRVCEGWAVAATARPAIELAVQKIEALAAASASRPTISGIGLVKAIKDQRDEVTDALRELVVLKDMHDTIENRGNGINAEEARALNREYKRRRPLAWEAARTAVGKVQTYEQQLRNVAEGIGMTYDELIFAMRARSERTTKP